MGEYSFEEKSTLGTLIVTLAIGFFYFRAAWDLWQSGYLNVGSTLGLATGLTILLVIVLIAYHIVIALASKPEDEDERDRLIGWRAGSIGGLVLGVAVIGIVLQILFGTLLGDPKSSSPVLIANALMASVFVATIVELAVKLYFYRAGV